jgi:hypothetical protein
MGTGQLMFGDGEEEHNMSQIVLRRSVLASMLVGMFVVGFFVGQ